MVGPPCKCSSCGLVFQTGAVEIGSGVSGITFVNCAVSCPRCGGVAPIGDGTYTSIGDVLRLDAGPTESQELLTQLEKIAQKARSSKLSVDEVLAEIADVSPELAQKIRGIGSWPKIGIVLLLFWIVKSFTLDIQVDFNWLIDQAWHISHGEDPERHLNSNPPQFPFDPEPAPYAPPAPRTGIEPGPFENRIARRRAKSESRRRSK